MAARADEWIERAKAGPKDTYVYRYYDAEDRLLYVGVTGNLDARHGSHKREKPWFGDVARRHVQGPLSNAAALAAEAWAITNESPIHNKYRSGGYSGPGSALWAEFESAELERLDAEQPGYLENEMRLALTAACAPFADLFPTPS